MLTRRALLLTALLACVPCVLHAAETPLRIHIISGSNEYKSEASLKPFAAELAKKYHVSITASWVKDGATDLPEVERIKDADVLLAFTRRMKLPADQLAIVKAHWEAGKPIVGIRTASHAFDNETNKVFDREVLGGDHQSHYANEPVTVTIDPAAKDHPVLQGTTEFTSRKLYKTGMLARGVTVLEYGDIGKGKQAVTWIHEYKGGRVFYTSLGVPEDFEHEHFRRMLTNAIFWTTKREVEKMKKS
ncbi:MAG: ThuA domain-containing protein [Phycisphaeraceae bacterium]